MDISIITQNLLSPPILFFALGMIATWVRSDLSIPPSVAKGLSVYLLFAIGLHGGVELHRSGFGAGVLWTLGAAAVGSAAVPLWSYAILRLKLKAPDAAAIAACYGSISAVTFITAVSFLELTEVRYSGYMVAAMALMESPAIVVGVLLAQWARRGEAGAGEAGGSNWGRLLHEAVFNGAVLLLVGSLVIGYLTGERGWESMKPLVKAPFKGVLCLFLLDMGLIAAKRLGDLRRAGPMVVGFSLVMPVLHAVLGIAIAAALGIGAGDALLLAVLFGSASYIAVPAAMRMALPEANPSLYVPMSLGLTFPLNITIGIPLYYSVIQWWWSSGL